ncbi:site-specific integrase [Dietzia sp. SL131]|uniref:tyrosine-type recombinase/integrase n=1 Tax=Dietzia sp. SL131 TaxID=2995149 RepID=UPI00227D4657|nr:site-specific integrase [Dietzia sp. SL131]MCY1656332.1 site-specific integrase [Dietzia sp. SL131]
MGRRATPVGELGRINFTKLNRDKKGDGIARGRVKGADGRLHAVEAYGPSRDKAEDNLRARAREVTGIYATAELSPATRLKDLVAQHLDDLDRVGDQRPQTRALYRLVLDDLDSDKGGPGELQLADCTRGRMRAWLESVEREHPAKARRIRVVLDGAFSLAADADALGGKASPLAGYRMAKRDAAAVRAATEGEIRELRQRAEDWVNDVVRDDDGNPVPTGRPGRARTATIIPIIELLISTGARISEVLAIRAEDLDLDSERPTVAIRGTLVPIDNKWVRQPLTKSARGHRTLTLTRRCVDALREHLEANPARRGELVFRSEAGTIIPPSNVRRQWRAIRGDDMAWLIPRSLRKTAATMIAREHGAEAAAAQLGNTRYVADRHYVERADVAPDRTNILEMI